MKTTWAIATALVFAFTTFARADVITAAPFVDSAGDGFNLFASHLNDNFSSLAADLGAESISVSTPNTFSGLGDDLKSAATELANNDPVAAAAFLDSAGDGFNLFASHLNDNFSSLAADLGAESISVSTPNTFSGLGDDLKLAAAELADTAAVPEPSTWALLTLAGIGFGGYQMRRRKKDAKR